jgi:hypothetical protein
MKMQVTAASFLVAMVPFLDQHTSRLLELIRVLQREITNDWQRNYQCIGPEMNEQGIIVVGKRLTEWMKNTWNRNVF